MGSKTYVLDTSAIIYGFNPRLVEGIHYITPGVEAELYAGRTKSVTEISIASGRLKVRVPRPEFVAVVKTRASSTGDLRVLSSTDLEVVALALELDSEGASVLVVSDDYSLQNLCTLLSIDFRPMVTKGISEEFWWFLFCPACGATYDQSKKLTACQVCGHALKRKVYSKRKITEIF
ncbi:MAG: nucleotide-binding protein [Candidatus Methanosuratus sp.]|nr:nucleotide-binding protein [Candidatus Methanosuratincola sp.]